MMARLIAWTVAMFVGAAMMLIPLYALLAAMQGSR